MRLAIGVILALSVPSLSAAEVGENHSVKCAAGAKCPPGVAKLVVLDDDFTEFQCTAFLVSDRLLMTNRHCLPESLQSVGMSCEKRISVLFPGGGAVCGKVLEFSDPPVEGRIEMQDYALLELKEPVERSPLKVRRTGVNAGEKITLWIVDGQGASQIKPVQCKALFGSLQWPFARGAQSPTLTFGGCRTDHGNSGSPVVSSAGEVVALLEGISSQRNADYFREKLERKDFERVQRASNMTCICVPGAKGAECNKPEECAAKLAEADILKMGNQLFEQALAKAELGKGLGAASGKTREEAGIRWKTGRLYDDQYAEARIRPDSFHFGFVPDCIADTKALAAGSTKAEEGSALPDFRKLANQRACPVKFQYSKSLEITKAELGKCAERTYAVAFDAGAPRILRVSVFDDGAKRVAWWEGPVTVCASPSAR